MHIPSLVILDSFFISCFGRSRLLRLLLKVHLHLITLCRKSATLSNTCALFHIYVQGPTLSRPYSAYVP